MPSTSTIKKRKLLKKLKAYEKERIKFSTIKSKTLKDKKPKPIAKGLNKFDRMEDMGLFYRDGYKVKKLRSDLMEGEKELGIKPEYLASGTNRRNKGISLILQKTRLANKVVGLNQPFRHLSLDFLD